MKKILTLTLFLSLAFMQGKIGGYAIFDYNGTTQQFDIDRTYFQYTNDISDNLFFKLRFDVGRDANELEHSAFPGYCDDDMWDTPSGCIDEGNSWIEDEISFNPDTKLKVYLKNAYVDWECPKGGKLTMGLLGTNSYGIQETNWGYRFISKSVLDQYGMTKTADFGIGYSHSFGDFNMNIQAVNGEGFKADFDSGNTNDDKPTAYIRLMYGEKNLIKNDGFNIGLVYTSAYNSTDDDHTNNLNGIFGGFASHNFRLGIEINNQVINETNESANAIYLNYAINEKIDVFIRHDVNDEDADDSDWSPPSQSLFGFIFNPTKGLYLAPNVTSFDAGDGSKSVKEYRFTCMFKY